MDSLNTHLFFFSQYYPANLLLCGPIRGSDRYLRQALPYGVKMMCDDTNNSLFVF